MLSRHGCFRVMKEAIPLIEKGHDVHLIVNKITQGSERFSSVSVYQDTDQFYNALKLHRNADIFHAHNEPSWFVTMVKDMIQDVPVILDIHDSHVLRKTDEEQREEEQDNPEAFRIAIDERNNFQLADGIVYCCDPMRDIVGREFRLEQPAIVLPSYLPRGYYRIDFDRWVGGVVYEGRIDLPDELPNKWKSFFRYADYLELGEAFMKLGMDFHVYTPRENEKVRERYSQVCILHEPQKVDRLIKLLGSHDWGLVGNIRKHTEWKNALPNKLFEYMAGCTPVVAMHADESARIIQEYDVGIVVESPEELRDRWKEHRAKRVNVVKHRMGFAMENHIHRLEKLYEEVIESTSSMNAIIPLKAHERQRI